MENRSSALLIKHQDGAGGYSLVTHREFVSEMIHAADMGHALHTRSVETRSGDRILVAWVADSQSGRALGVFELPGDDQ